MCYSTDLFLLLLLRLTESARQVLVAVVAVVEKSEEEQKLYPRRRLTQAGQETAEHDAFDLKKLRTHQCQTIGTSMHMHVHTETRYIPPDPLHSARSVTFRQTHHRKDIDIK